MPYLEAMAGGPPIPGAGPPVNGTDEVQTITFAGTPTGGTFRISYEGATTANIPWSATNATLIASIDAALEALATIGTGNVVTAAGTLTAGIGTVTVTFSAGMGKKAVPTMTVAANALTGTAPTIAIAETTPGVDATLRGAGTGALYTDSTAGKLYQNTGTPAAPLWVSVGSQT